MSQKAKASQPKGVVSSQSADPIVIRFCSPVQSNERHPLADVAPEVRAAEREAVIARVLARLVEAAADIRQRIGTMNADIALFDVGITDSEARSNEAD